MGWSLFALAIALAVAFAIVPRLPVWLDIPELTLDLSAKLGGAANLVDSTSITAKLKFDDREQGGYRVNASGRLLDWPYRANGFLEVGFIFAKGEFVLALEGSPWTAEIAFELNGAKEWSFTAKIPEEAFTEEDPVLASLLAHLDSPDFAFATVKGSLSLEASGESTLERPVPSWKVKGLLKDASVTSASEEKPLSVESLRLPFGAEGLADRVDISPIFLRAKAVSFAGFSLTNAFASVRATERSYLVTEAGAGWCGGELKVYSLFLDPKKLNAGATIFVEGVEAGEVMKLVKGLKGDATGKLHGKLPVYLKEGEELSLGDAYLFSTPGEGGVLRLEDSSAIVENLAAGGVPAETRSNLAKALLKLDYTVVKVDLRRGEGEDERELELKIEGSATEGKTTVPVHLDLTFRGKLEKLLNTGMKLSRRKQPKGEK